jgi:hypothetical protein
MKFAFHAAPFVRYDGTGALTFPQYAQIEQLFVNCGTCTQTYELPLVFHDST